MSFHLSCFREQILTGIRIVLKSFRGSIGAEQVKLISRRQCIIFQMRLQHFFI
jgi:hypothetical protein